MAYDVSQLEDYVNEQNFPLLKRTLFSAKSAGLFQLQTGVKSSATLNRFENDVVFQADGCSRTAAGDSTFSQREINVGKIAIHQDFCPKDLEAKALQTQLKAGSRQDEMPFEQTFAEDTADRIAKNIEKAIWQGDSESADENLNKFDGLLKILDGSAESVEGNPGGHTEITDANIEGIIDDVYQAIPADIIAEGDVAIMLGMDNYRLYAKALKDSNLYHYDADSTDFELVVPGTNVRLIGLNGLNDTDRIVAGQLSNFYVGVDLEDEEEDFEVWYSRDDRVVKFTTAFKYGTQVAWPDQVVVFEPATA